MSYSDERYDRAIVILAEDIVEQIREEELEDDYEVDDYLETAIMDINDTVKRLLKAKS